MQKLAVDMHPGWFDWLSLVVTVFAAVVPAWIAIMLWRLDRRAMARDRRDAATRQFTHLLATGDRVLVRFRDFGHFAEALGPGATALMGLINQYLEWDRDDDLAVPDDRGSTAALEPRIDLSVDVSDAIRRWNADPAYRADLTEVYLANGSVFPAEEDNRIISPTTRRAAEEQVLLNSRAFRVWLSGTRLSPSRIRWRRLVTRLGLRRRRLVEPLNPLATREYIEDDELAGDPWLRARTTATLDDED